MLNYFIIHTVYSIYLVNLKILKSLKNHQRKVFILYTIDSNTLTLPKTYPTHFPDNSHVLQVVISLRVAFDCILMTV